MRTKKSADINEALSDMRKSLISEKEAIDGKLSLIDELIAKACGIDKKKVVPVLKAINESAKPAKIIKQPRKPRGENAAIGGKIYEAIAAAPGKKCTSSTFKSLCGDKSPSTFINAWNKAKGNEAKQIKAGGKGRAVEYSVA